MTKRYFALIIIVLSFFLTFNLSRGVWDAYRNKNKLEQSQKTLEQVKEENALLKKDLEYKQSQFFIEKEAREKLNLSKQNEVVAILPELSNFDKTPKKEILISNWERWYRLFLD